MAQSPPVEGSDEIVVCLDPPLLADLLVRALRLEGIHASACPVVDRRRRPRAVRRVGVVITSVGLPLDLEARAVLVVAADVAGSQWVVSARDVVCHPAHVRDLSGLIRITAQLAALAA